MFFYPWDPWSTGTRLTRINFNAVANLPVQTFLLILPVTVNKGLKLIMLPSNIDAPDLPPQVLIINSLFTLMNLKEKSMN